MSESNKFFEFLGKITPQIVQDWVKAWAELVKGTIFVRPDSDPAWSVTAICLATLLTVICVFVFWEAPRRRVQNLLKISLAGTALSFVLILVVRWFLSDGISMGAARALYLSYDVLQVLFTVCAILAVLFAVMAGIKGANGKLKSWYEKHIRKETESSSSDNGE